MKAKDFLELSEKEIEMTSYITSGIEHMSYVFNNQIEVTQVILILSIKRELENLSHKDQNHPGVIAKTAYFKSLLSKIEKATNILPFC